MTNQHLAANYLQKMKRTWVIRYEDEQKLVALIYMSIAADGGEAKPKNIFNSRKNVEETIPFKKRLNSYRYEDFQPPNEERKERTAPIKKNSRPRNSRSNSSDAEKPQFVPAPYEKPVTRRQARKPANEQTKSPTPMPKVQANGKRKRQSGKENQQNANNQSNKPNNCKQSTSKVEINSPTEPSINEQQQEHLSQQQQLKQQQNELKTTATDLKGDDLITLLKMVAKKESSESQAIVDMVKSDDGLIDYSMKPKEQTKILIQKKPSPGTSNNKRKKKSKSTKFEPLKIRLVSTSIQGMALHNKPLVL